MKFRLLTAALAAFLAIPALAQAAQGYATANVNMRSGPSTAYPAVVVIPVGSRLEIHGCLSSEAWCDVSFSRGRGWVAGRYIQAVYGGNRVYVDRPYYQRLGIPSIVFDLDTYWGRHYRQRDFYRDRDEWRPNRRPPPAPGWNGGNWNQPRPPRPDQGWNDRPPQRPDPNWNQQRPPRGDDNWNRPRPPRGNDDWNQQRPPRGDDNWNQQRPPRGDDNRDQQRPPRPDRGNDGGHPQRPPQQGFDQQRPERPPQPPQGNDQQRPPAPNAEGGAPPVQRALPRCSPRDGCADR